MNRQTSLYFYRSPFSLVELMIVISILGILMSLLQPTLQKVIKSSESLNCSQNLHHFNNAVVFYTDDNEDYYLPYGNPNGNGLPTSTMWFAMLEEYHDRIDSARICPTTEKSKNGWAWGSTTTTWRWGGMHGSYAYNGYFYSIHYGRGNTREEMPSWFTDYYFYKQQDVKHPSSTGIIADSSWVDAWPRSSQNGPVSASMGGQGGETSMARLAVNRHDWATNVLKADGSVGHHKLEELWSQVYWNGNDQPKNAPTINP